MNCWAHDEIEYQILRIAGKLDSFNMQKVLSWNVVVAMRRGDGYSVVQMAFLRSGEVIGRRDLATFLSSRLTTSQSPNTS
jgi:hypothetical protein